MKKILYMGLGVYLWAMTGLVASEGTDENQPQKEPQQVEAINFKIVNEVISEIFNEIIKDDNLVKQLALSFDPDYSDLNKDQLKVKLFAEVGQNPWQETEGATSDLALKAKFRIAKSVVTREDGTDEEKKSARINLSLAYKTPTYAFLRYLVTKAKKHLARDVADAEIDAVTGQKIVVALDKVNAVVDQQTLGIYASNLRNDLMQALKEQPLRAEGVANGMDLKDIAEAIAFLYGVKVDAKIEYNDKAEPVYKNVTLNFDRAVAVVQDDEDRVYQVSGIVLALNNETVQLSAKVKIENDELLSYYYLYKPVAVQFLQDIQARLNLDDIREMAQSYYDMVKDWLSKDSDSESTVD